MTVAEPTPVLEAASLQADLERAGIQPWAWVINNSLAAARPTSPLLQHRAHAEQDQVDVVTGRPGRRVVIIPMLVDEPVGIPALTALSAAGVVAAIA